MAECKETRTCIYGGYSGRFSCCDYYLITGNRRTGHPVINGKCDLYQKGKKIRVKKGDVTVPYDRFRKFNEV